MSNHQGMYLGDERMEPFWDALDKRAAIVLIHPTSPHVVTSERIAAKVPQTLTEFFFDTGRSVVDLVTADVLERYPAIRFIVSHAGAVLPIVTQRVDIFLPLLTPARDEPLPLLRDAMAKLHFDLAGVPVPELLSGLLNLADPTHLYYGSDHPFTPPVIIDKLLDDIVGTPLLTDDMRRAVFGAVWAQAETRKVLGAIGARVLDRELPVPSADEQFGPDGRLSDADLEAEIVAVLEALRDAVAVRVSG